MALWSQAAGAQLHIPVCDEQCVIAFCARPSTQRRLAILVALTRRHAARRHSGVAICVVFLWAAKTSVLVLRFTCRHTRKILTRRYPVFFRSTFSTQNLHFTKMIDSMSAPLNTYLEFDFSRVIFAKNTAMKFEVSIFRLRGWTIGIEYLWWGDVKSAKFSSCDVRKNEPIF